MNTTPSPDEPEHDAMLRAALRHAPDRDARPPEAVSAQILRRAQQATAASSSGGAWQALRRRLDALTRPAPAAAFASLMLATLVGVMWQEGPPPERRDDRDPSAAQVRLEAPTAATEVGTNGRGTAPGIAADSVQATRSVEIEASTALPKRSAVPPPAPTAPAVPSPLTRSSTPADTAATAKAATATAAGAAAAPSAAPPEAAARPEIRREQAATSDATPAAAPSDAAAAPARRTEDEARRASSPPDAKTAEAGTARERDSAAPASPQAAIAGRSEPARARSEPIAPTRNMLATAADPLAPLAEGWAATEAQRAALDELRRLSAGRWARVPAAALPPSAELRRTDGQPLGRLAITDDAVLWLPQVADGSAWRAPLEPAVAADLRRRLALPPGR